MTSVRGVLSMFQVLNCRNLFLGWGFGLLAALATGCSAGDAPRAKGTAQQQASQQVRPSFTAEQKAEIRSAFGTGQIQQTKVKGATQVIEDRKMVLFFNPADGRTGCYENPESLFNDVENNASGGH